MRRITSFVGPAGQSIGNRIERRGSRPPGLDKGQDLTQVLWRQRATALLRVDPIELGRTAKGPFMRPNARDPDWDARLLQGGGQKLHLRELVLLFLVADLLTTPQARQDGKPLIELLSMNA